MNRLRIAGAACAMIALAASPALATGNFPPAIQSDLQLDSPPPCSYCHVGSPGPGTVRKPFGLALRQRGLVPGDEESLRNALDQLQADKVDSDGDGIPDIQELKEGTDPNEAAVGIEPAAYGCGQAQPSRASPGVAAWALAALLGLQLAKTRRKAALAPRHR